MDVEKMKKLTTEKLNRIAKMDRIDRKEVFEENGIDISMPKLPSKRLINHMAFDFGDSRMNYYIVNPFRMDRNVAYRKEFFQDGIDYGTIEDKCFAILEQNNIDVSEKRIYSDYDCTGLHFRRTPTITKLSDYRYIVKSYEGIDC